MVSELPGERQLVEVHFDNRDWLSAIYRRGEFVDIYGFTLDREKISSWRAAEADDACEHPVPPRH
jgi:hypothetical protein